MIPAIHSSCIPGPFSLILSYLSFSFDIPQRLPLLQPLFQPLPQRLPQSLPQRRSFTRDPLRSLSRARLPNSEGLPYGRYYLYCLLPPPLPPLNNIFGCLQTSSFLHLHIQFINQYTFPFAASRAGNSDLF